MDNKKEVEAFVESLRPTRIKSFYDTFVMKRTGVDQDITQEALAEMVEKGKLFKTYELMCFACFRVVKRSEDEHSMEDVEECKFCGNTEGSDGLGTSFRYEFSDKT